MDSPLVEGRTFGSAGERISPICATCDRRAPPRGTTWVWRLEPALPYYPTQILPAMAAINPGPNRTMNYGGSIPEIYTSARVNMEDCLWPT